MKITAHCFAYNARIEPLPIKFQFKDFMVCITSHQLGGKYNLILEITKKIDPEEVSIEGEVQDENGIFIEKRMRLYKESLKEVSNLIEGYLSLMYNDIPIKFESDKIMVNVLPENDHEKKLIEEDKVTRGFGNIHTDKKYPLYQWSQEILKSIPEASNHIPAFSFLSQAIRSQAENNQEIAFFLFFRILEGYSSDGASDIEKAMLSKKDFLIKYIDYTENLKSSLNKALTELKIKSKSEVDFSGLITDLVLLRHKLTHFSETNSSRHHKPSILFELNIINFYLRKACIRLLRDKAGIDKQHNKN